MPEDIDLPGQDKTIQLMPEDYRRDMAELGRSNLYFFAKSILGYKDMTEGCHGPMCEWLDRNPSRFKLLLMPRNHYKSTVATISRGLQRVCRNPESRQLIANETTKNTERFLSAIQSHAESNRMFRTLYSKIIPKDLRKVRWNSSEMDFARKGHYPEPTIDTVGMTGTMTSRHYTHITVDDPISEEAAKSDKVMADTINRLGKIIPLMVKPERDTFDFVGTRWAFHDVYSWLMKNYGSKLAKYIRGAIEDGQPIFPELISLETLAQARIDAGEYAFSCLYMNNPRNSSVQDFNVQDLKFYAWNAAGDVVTLFSRDGEIEDQWHISQLDITVTVDPAPAEKVTSDRNAVVTCGTSPKSQSIVLDVFAKRCTALAVIEHLFYLHERFGPRVFGIEDVAYQKVLKQFVNAEAIRRNTYLNIVPLPAKAEKNHRIRGLQPVAAVGRLFIHPTQHLLRNELSDFPLGEHDDAADALSMQLLLWRGQNSPQEQAKSKEAIKKALQAIRSDNDHSPVSAKQNSRLVDIHGRAIEFDPDIDDPEDAAPSYIADYVVG